MTQQQADQKNFREAMAQLSSAVSILTTSGDAGTCGITVTAVCSITDSPPTLIACINRNSKMNAIFQANKKLCVNVLNNEQEMLAKHFAGMTDTPMEERFSWNIWNTGASGVPILKHCIATLEGEIDQIAEVGTHSIYFVKLSGIAVAEAGDALVYFNRSFHTTPRVKTS
ncbi:4-hydroxyphenylacetate 3-monooxygenase [Gammaproteobacteria bacterium]|nr:4-hydroxyphenylacetate 3-monooxygenase [Gammaproteobacteria bacterium]